MLKIGHNRAFAVSTLLIFVLLAMLITSTALGYDGKTEDSLKPSATITVNGEVYDLVEGLIIENALARDTFEDQKDDEIDIAKIAATGPEGIQLDKGISIRVRGSKAKAGHFSAQITGDGEGNLIVKNVSFAESVNNGESRSSTKSCTTYTGSAKSTFLCGFGVTSTEVYAELTYQDCDTYVTTIDHDNWTYHSPAAYLIDEWDGGYYSSHPVSNCTWTMGEFDSNAPGDQHHTHLAQFAGYCDYPWFDAYFWYDDIPEWVPGVDMTWDSDVDWSGWD